MENFFKTRIERSRLPEIEVSIKNYDNLIHTLKRREFDLVRSMSTQSRFYDIIQEWNSKRSIYLESISTSFSLIDEEEIDINLDPVGYAKQLKRKRQALVQIDQQIKKSKKKLLRIQRGIFKSVCGNTKTKDFRKGLRQILRKNIRLSNDEENINSAELKSVTISATKSNELVNNIKIIPSWIRKELLRQLKIHLSKKNYLLKIELH